MRTIINKRSYNTEKDSLVGHRIFGEYGDSKGYEEFLYCTFSKQYYIFGQGGEESRYPSPTITLVRKTKAKAWIAAMPKEMSTVSGQILWQ